MALSAGSDATAVVTIDQTIHVAAERQKFVIPRLMSGLWKDEARNQTFGEDRSPHDFLRTDQIRILQNALLGVYSKSSSIDSPRSKTIETG